MDKLLIQGGQPLEGSVEISGAKNAALPILAACLLTDEPLILENVPSLKDIDTMLKILEKLGVEWERNGTSVALNAKHITKTFAPYELVKTMRAAILVLGPLTARFKEAHVSLPGGCAIGSRPVDQHISGLKSMGANIVIDQGYIIAKTKKLSGCRIFTDMPTVTGTENLMLAACLAEGETVIENAAKEPEIVDLADCLIKMGASIKGAGTNIIIIQGKKKLHGTTHRILPDRIETGTLLCAAALTRGNITLTNTNTLILDAVIEKLRDAQCHIDIKDSKTIFIKAPQKLASVSIRTAPYPAFPTDMQAQFMALNTLSLDTAVIRETIFENRFMHAIELSRLGANIRIEGNTAFVKGVKKLSGATVMATDLRASASLVIAALAAEGETVVDRIYHLDRGYENFEKKLASLGAKINRI